MRMALTTGPHHVATLTADMDRLQRFYTRVFDAQVVWDLREEGLRHAFIDLGSGFMLHPFEIADVDVPQGELPLFGRGRIDHLALRAATAEVFWDVRERIYREGARDGQVADLGPLLSAGCADPDGLWGRSAGIGGHRQYGAPARRRAGDTSRTQIAPNPDASHTSCSDVPRDQSAALVDRNIVALHSDAIELVWSWCAVIGH